MSPQPSQSDPSSTVSQRLGRYVLTGTLGKGAMGTVFRAEDPLIERKLALKVLSLDLSAEERAQFSEHFLREGKAAGRLNHPNIVTVYDIGESEGVPYIAMEFLQGLTLRESLDMGNVMPVRRVVDIGLAVCRGLDFAHGQGVIHRDIKPANIMLTRSGMVKIMDFGIASTSLALAHDGTQAAGQVLGSPKYMAPEQLQGQEADARADLFALGVTMYELLVGSHPFEAGTVGEVVGRVLGHHPPSARELNPDVPVELDQLVQAAMHKNPAQRIESAREMARTLRTLRRELRASSAAGRTLPGRPAAAGDGSAATIVVTPAQARESLPVAPQRRVLSVRHALLAVGAVALAAALVFGLSDFGRAPAEALPAAREAALAPPPAPVEAPPEIAIVAPPVLLAPPVDEAPPAALQALPVEPRPAVRARPPAASAKPPPPAAPAEIPPPAMVSFAVQPWGEILIDGKRAGVTPPLRNLVLPPGRHRVEIRNLDFPPYVAELRLESGARHAIEHRFGQ